MESRIKKRVRDSVTEQVQIVLPEHTNGHGRLFGGRLVEWIDVVAAVVARRHSNRHVTTASIDSLDFRNPVYQNDTVVLVGKLTYVGNTSMEVRVDTYVESLYGTKQVINTAFLTMVALDDNQKPTKVPGLILETEEEKKTFEEGRRRRGKRKAAKQGTT
jgi:acyl-CoA hydrolase